MDAAIAKTEDALAVRLEKLDDLGTAQGVKLLRVLSVVDEWETAAAQAATTAEASGREAAAEAASQALEQLQSAAATAAQAAVKPLAEQLELVDQSARESAAQLTLQLEKRPWARALELNDEVDALRSELAVRSGLTPKVPWAT